MLVWSMYSSVPTVTYFMNINLEEEKNFLLKLRLQNIFQFPSGTQPRLFDTTHLKKEETAIWGQAIAWLEHLQGRSKSAIWSKDNVVRNSAFLQKVSVLLRWLFYI